MKLKLLLLLCYHAHLLVLVVEIGEINDQIFDNKHVGQRGIDSGLGSVSVNGLEASHSVGAINVHSTRPTNPFPTRPPGAEA